MTYIATYLLGIITFGVFMLMKLRRRTPPPTLYRRRNRDRLAEFDAERVTAKWRLRTPSELNVPPMPECRAAREDEVGGISYQWLGVTGSEQE